MSERRHFHLFTVANQSAHHEVVYRMEGMEITQNHLMAVKQAGAKALLCSDNNAAIINHIYLGFMTEEAFSGEELDGQA